MEKVITCPCGVVIRGATDEEVVAQAQRHAKGGPSDGPDRGAGARDGETGLIDRGHRLGHAGYPIRGIDRSTATDYGTLAAMKRTRTRPF